MGSRRCLVASRPRGQPAGNCPPACVNRIRCGCGVSPINISIGSRKRSMWRSARRVRRLLEPYRFISAPEISPTDVSRSSPTWSVASRAPRKLAGDCASFASSTFEARSYTLRITSLHRRRASSISG